MPKRKQPGLYPTPQKRAEWDLRRYQMLELYKGGATERQIGETLGVDKGQVHREIKRVLSDLAEKYSGMADQIRGLQMERYTTLLARWWPQALAADETATRMVMSILHRISEINGVIPKEPLITIDQRSIQLAQGEVTFSIEAASGTFTNGNSPHGDIPETQSIPEATDGDLLS